MVHIKKKKRVNKKNKQKGILYILCHTIARLSYSILLLAGNVNSRGGIFVASSQVLDPKKDQGTNEVKNCLTTWHFVLICLCTLPFVSKWLTKGVE